MARVAEPETIQGKGRMPKAQGLRPLGLLAKSVLLHAVLLHAAAIARGHHRHRLRHGHHRRRTAVAVARCAAIAVRCHVARVRRARIARNARRRADGSALRVNRHRGRGLLRERVAATAAAAGAKHHGCQCQDYKCSLHCSIVPEGGDTPFHCDLSTANSLPEGDASVSSPRCNVHPDNHCPRCGENQTRRGVLATFWPCGATRLTIERVVLYGTNMVVLTRNWPTTTRCSHDESLQ